MSKVMLPVVTCYHKDALIPIALLLLRSHREMFLKAKDK